MGDEDVICCFEHGHGTRVREHTRGNSKGMWQRRDKTEKNGKKKVKETRENIAMYKAV